jgi:hypothetical protein
MFYILLKFKCWYVTIIITFKKSKYVSLHITTCVIFYFYLLNTTTPEGKKININN